MHTLWYSIMFKVLWIHQLFLMNGLILTKYDQQLHNGTARWSADKKAWVLLASTFVQIHTKNWLVFIGVRWKIKLTCFFCKIQNDLWVWPFSICEIKTIKSFVWSKSFFSSDLDLCCLKRCQAILQKKSCKITKRE